MTPEQFVYWLQGYNEISQSPPSPAQWQVIVDHLESVFTKVTPIRSLTASNVIHTSPTPACVPARSIGSPVSVGSVAPNAQRPPEPSGVFPTLNFTMPPGPSGVLFPLDNRNKGYCYVTITENPRWSESSASSYWGDDRTAIIKTLNDTLRVNLNPEKTYVVVSNSLNPKTANVDNLRGEGNHLHGFSKTAPGIQNIGLGESLIC